MSQFVSSVFLAELNNIGDVRKIGKKFTLCVQFFGEVEIPNSLWQMINVPPLF